MPKMRFKGGGLTKSKDVRPRDQKIFNDPRETTSDVSKNALKNDKFQNHKITILKF